MSYGDVDLYFLSPCTLKFTMVWQASRQLALLSTHKQPASSVCTETCSCTSPVKKVGKYPTTSPSCTLSCKHQLTFRTQPLAFYLDGFLSCPVPFPTQQVLRAFFSFSRSRSWETSLFLSSSIAFWNCAICLKLENVKSLIFFVRRTNLHPTLWAIVLCIQKEHPENLDSYEPDQAHLVGPTYDTWGHPLPRGYALWISLQLWSFFDCNIVLIVINRVGCRLWLWLQLWSWLCLFQ